MNLHYRVIHFLMHNSSLKSDIPMIPKFIAYWKASICLLLNGLFKCTCSCNHICIYVPTTFRLCQCTGVKVYVWNEGISRVIGFLGSKFNILNINKPYIVNIDLKNKRYTFHITCTIFTNTDSPSRDYISFLRDPLHINTANNLTYLFYNLKYTYTRVTLKDSLFGIVHIYFIWYILQI